MLRSLTLRLDAATASTAPGVPPILVAVRTLVLLVVLATIPLAEPRLGHGARGTALAVALGVAAACWLVWLVLGRSLRVTAATLAVLGLAGGVLAGLSPLSTAIAVACVVTSAAGIRLSAVTSIAITAGTIAAFLATAVETGAPAQTLLGYPLAFFGLWALGLTRRAYLLRAELAERTLAETRRARDAETHAAALAERARMAREIHDVLAHSLAAVSVNLQAADGLLSALPAGNQDLVKAIECIGRAQALTRDGLAEARRAVLALRDDAVPLGDQLAALAAEYRAAGDLSVDFQLAGQQRQVPADTGLAVYRTAQEALTNARKHAPGQPVSLSLQFSQADVAVRIANPLPGLAPAGPLSGSGSGQGLTGLRERAALAGGTLTAGPAEGQWQVSLRIPA